MSKCKVFCGLCKYSKKHLSWEDYGCTRYKKPVQTPIHRYLINGDCVKLNKDNDCEGYEEDWTITVKRKIMGFFK